MRNRLTLYFHSPANSRSNGSAMHAFSPQLRNQYLEVETYCLISLFEHRRIEEPRSMNYP